MSVREVCLATDIYLLCFRVVVRLARRQMHMASNAGLFICQASFCLVFLGPPCGDIVGAAHLEGQWVS